MFAHWRVDARSIRARAPPVFDLLRASRMLLPAAPPLMHFVDREDMFASLPRSLTR